MKTIAPKKQTEVHGGMSPVVMAVTGAVIGAGIAVAGVGAVALKDEKNRQKVKEVLDTAKDHAVDYIEDLTMQVLSPRRTIHGFRLQEAQERFIKD